MNNFLKAVSLGLALPVSAFAQSFLIDDIRVEGLQRVSAGTVFSSLPVRVGDEIESLEIQNLTRALFRTGFFADIQIGRENGVLVITVRERPAIAKIEITGNKAIKTEDLLKGMSDNGLAEGQIFRRATLEGLAQELERQYVAQGRYGASVSTEVKELPRNQVELKVVVDEGSVAAIKHINVVGNEAFSDSELEEIFELQTTGWLSWIKNDDKYSSEKLQGDLEKLKSFYLDRGYLQFRNNSTQVSLSPDKESVFITINISEGDVYKVSEVELAGDLIVPEEEIKRLMWLRKGQTFSQFLMTRSSEWITQRLGNEGYTFAEVRGIPEANDEDKTVKITFFVDPGKRAYVRRINFRGNTRTSDEVLRREMVQMEAASASSARIEQSKVELERLGFFKEVQVATTEVPGTSDQIDVEYTVEEQSSGSIGGTVGYAQGSGLILGANVSEKNWLGTGKTVAFGLNTSKYQTYGSISYVDPFFTPDGVSRGFNVFYEELDYSEVNFSDYRTEKFGVGLNFGYPLSQNSRVQVNFGADHLEVNPGGTPAKELSSEILPPLLGVDDKGILEGDITAINTAREEGGSGNYSRPFDSSLLDQELTGFLDVNGNEFNTFSVTGSYVYSTLNRGLFPTDGIQHRASMQVSVPGSDLEYYKLTYTGQYFRPIPFLNNWTLRLRTELGYGDGYGDTQGLPFFYNYRAGGFGSVRGFERNTLGPKSTPASYYNSNACVVEKGEVIENCYVLSPDGKSLETVSVDVDDDRNAFGGNILVEGSMEIIFPLPFIKDQRSMQTAFFVDAGNVFSTNCGVTQLDCHDLDLDYINVSAGIGLTWITGFGPLTFSLAKALRKNENAETEVFQFSLGNSF